MMFVSEEAPSSSAALSPLNQLSWSERQARIKASRTSRQVFPTGKSKEATSAVDQTAEEEEGEEKEVCERERQREY